MTEQISIILPVFNVEGYLRECIDSILCQTYTNFELIIIDDGSSDHSGQICDEYGKIDSRITVIHQHNQGLSAARNRGIAEAKGEYIAFVDSDDMIYPHTYEKAIKAALENEADIVCFDIMRVDNAGENIGAIECPHKNELLDMENALCALCGARIRDYAWNKLYKRELFADVGYPVGKLMEDVYTTYKVFLKAQKIYCLDEILYAYRQRVGSILHTITSNVACSTFMSGYTRYVELSKAHMAAAEECFVRTGMAALDVYNHSLWESVDREALECAVEFLADNEEKMKRMASSRDLSIYYGNKPIYRIYRRVRHKLADAVKSLKACAKK